MMAQLDVSLAIDIFACHLVFSTPSNASFFVLSLSSSAWNLAPMGIFLFLGCQAIINSTGQGAMGLQDSCTLAAVFFSK
jgi:hypothetical protein